MHLSRVIFSLFALAAPLAGHLSAQPASEDNYIENAYFRSGHTEGIPNGWVRAGEEGTISLIREDDITFVRMVAEKPHQLVGIKQAVPMPEGVLGVVFEARFRNENVKFGKNFLRDARTRFWFEDAEGNKIKAKTGDVIFDSHAQEWRNISKEFLVPENAKILNVLVCLNRPKSGTLDVQAVRLSAMDEEKAKEKAMIPILAAKKKAEDEKEVRQMIELPSKTLELHVEGNKLVDAKGNRVILQGVNVPSLEWSYKGENIHRSMKVALVDWNANVVRLPVAAGFWFGRGKKKIESNDAEAYRTIVDEAVNMAAGQGKYLILDLHSYGAPREFAVEFWKDAAARYANNPAVIFDLYNEPHGISWDLWQNGGTKQVKNKKTKETKTIEVVGMQALVDAVRSTGAKNLISASGVSYALNISGVLKGHALRDPGGNGIMYSTHFYNWHGGWQKHFLNVAEQYPVLVGEFGADKKKMSFIPAHHQEDPNTFIPDALGMIQKYNLNWTAFSLHPKATPVLIRNWNYEPTPFFGAYVKQALEGKTFEPGMR